MVEENNNQENMPIDEVPMDDENIEENVQATASEALYNELTDYIQKQIALINEKKEGKSVAKIYQNEDIVDALKFAQEFKKTRKIKEKQLSINNFNDFCELVSKNKIISNYEINALTLNNKTVEQAVIVEHCNISKLNFQKCTFKDNVQFKNCKIHRIDLTNAMFEQNLSFENCDFDSSVLKGFEVGNVFKLLRCTVAHRCRISKVKAQSFNFWDARFNEWLEINSCEVTGDADMRSINVEGGIEFVRNTFNNLIMRGANVQRPIYMRNTKITGVFDFQRAKFRDYAYFEELEFEEDSKIALWNVVSYGIFISPDQVVGRLRSESERDFATAASEYGTLKANYQFLNKLDDEDWAYFRFKKMNRLAHKQQSKGIGSKFGNFFEWLFFEFGSRYGTSPLRVLGLSLIFILAFAAIYFFPVLFGYMEIENASSVMKYYEITGLSAVDVPVSAVLHSMSAFVSGFDAVDKNVDGWVSIFLSLEAMAGMLFLGLFIVSFSRKVIR